MRFTRLDPEDPLAIAFNAVKRKAITLLLILVAVSIGLAAIGVPHFQLNYQYLNTGERYIPIEQRQVVSGNYIGPFGRRFEQGPRQPVVKFIPLHRCIDLQPYQSAFPFNYLPKEYRDGQTN